MLLNLTLPRINDLMTSARITALRAAAGDPLAPGAALMDVCVDLSGVAPHDCPPITHYRFVMRDGAVLRDLAVAAGDEVPVGAPLALFTTEATESLEGRASREARITIAGILGETDGW